MMCETLPFETANLMRAKWMDLAGRINEAFTQYLKLVDYPTTLFKCCDSPTVVFQMVWYYLSSKTEQMSKIQLPLGYQECPTPELPHEKRDLFCNTQILMIESRWENTTRKESTLMNSFSQTKNLATICNIHLLN